MVALASFPLYLFICGAPSALELLVFAWLAVQILTAYFLSRTGRYESAHVMSSLALTGLVAAIVCWSLMNTNEYLADLIQKKLTAQGR